MDAAFWHERWAEGRIGFHQPHPSPLLETCWPALGIAPDSRVFVPLAGKSLDMVWLAERGHRVFGVELSELAIRQFFDERDLTPEQHTTPCGRLYRAGPYELLCGDAFSLDAGLLADCAGVYDRAALVALPPALRATYADTCLHRLPAGCRGLLITLEYPQAQKDGPPFSVEPPEVALLLASDWTMHLLERHDILAEEPGFSARGVDALTTAIWRLERRPGT
ncbi:thiopurine S-methyltransferase [Luteimonas abyssi]|uniref:thiopurine S-methyltransferase n=1 Tax=Luteimonas abyssi TaxID=1247514 RepID=UPI000737D40F|nr:thiopurine S-methyltransferase [Luteimonas abyssi]